MNKISSISVLALMILLASCKVPESKAWVVTTFAGSTEGFADGTGAAAMFNQPSGVAVDSSGIVYVGDTLNNRIRKITPAGVVTTFAGSDTRGHKDATGTEAQFKHPGGVAVDSSGTVFVADYGNHCIRKITQAGVVTTLAGTHTDDGFKDATGTEARFTRPSGVAVDSSGNVYVADSGNHRIRKITPEGVVTTFAGSGTAGSEDGTGTDAQFKAPGGVAVDSSGNVFVADYNNHRIRKITPADRIEDRVVSTLAGDGTADFADGAGTTAQFNSPNGVAVDSSGTVYVTDKENHRIRKITQAGVVSTLAGRTSGYKDGTGTDAQFKNPDGVAVDSSGTVYVADTLNHRIRKIEYKVP